MTLKITTWYTKNETKAAQKEILVKKKEVVIDRANVYLEKRRWETSFHPVLINSTM
jgi:hypothetical protein